MKLKLNQDYLDNMYLDNGDIVEGNAISALIEADVFYELPAKDSGGKETIGLYVNCNDLFYWACADCESIPFSEIRSLYERVFDKDGNYQKWGSTIWACLRRGMRPQHPIEDAMKKDGFWTDELEALPIRENTG